MSQRSTSLRVLENEVGNLGEGFEAPIQREHPATRSKRHSRDQAVDAGTNGEPLRTGRAVQLRGIFPVLSSIHRDHRPT